MRKSTDRSVFREKQGLLDEFHPPPRRPARRERLIRHVLPAILLLTAAYLLFRKVFVCHHHYDAAKGLEHFITDDDRTYTTEKNNTRIKLEAHIMSKCPDAQECLEMLVVPTMVKASDMVDFTLSYIGKIDPKSDDVQCMHGPGECLGNIIQLCAQKVYPDPKQFLGFSNCMISDYEKIPDRELVENCAMEYGLDFKQLNSCISSEGEGSDLLRQSIKRSQDNHVTKSCTVRLEDKIWCIRDGGEWSDCPHGSTVSDLTDEIKKLHKKRQASQN